MKYYLYKENFIIFIVPFIFLCINPINLTPLSSCTKGRISQYNWNKEGICGFGTTQNTIGQLYRFPAAPNQDLFRNSAQCGVCYEIVGPNGAIRVRVEDYCRTDSNSGLCKGDMYHFNISSEGTSYIMGSADKANVTFRMVSCDYSGNIRILTNGETNKFYLSFVVLDHNLAVSKVEIQQYNSTISNNLARTLENKWVHYNFNSEIAYPLNIRIYSINGDYVTVIMNSPEGNKYYEANGNFIIPNNLYFNISTLNKINNINTNNLNKCCERDKSDFTPIYNNGYLNGGYSESSQGVTVIYNSTDSYLGKYSLNAKFQSFGILNYIPSFPIRADQYYGIFFSIKSNRVCSNCLYVRAYDLTSYNQIISIDKANEWKNYTFDFNTLGINNNEFNGIVFSYYQYSTDNLEVNIDKIELIPNPNAPDAGICFNVSNGNTNNTNINIEPYDNNKQFNYININSININENSPQILNINCNQFTNYDNKKISLKLISKNTLNNFEISNCSYSNPYVISSFTCTLPSNISDDFYNIRTITTNGLNFSYAEDLEIKNGLLICGNVNSTMSKYKSVYYSPIIIIYSKEQNINKGDKVKFDIYPIPQEEYNLDNDEIVLLNNNGDKSLHLKYCHQNIKNKTVYSVQCVVSNNIMKENYTNLYSDQVVSLLDGQTVSLVGSNSNGGMLIKNHYKVMETNLTQAQKRNFNVTFNLLYYNSNIRPGDEFPHKVYLYGNRKYTRKLDDKTIYDSQINFQNCTAGTYSSEDPSAIGSIICRFPDFVPAGTYTKLESDGIDINPGTSINYIFEKDFNRSLYSKDTGISNYSQNSNKKKSKDWIVWLIVGILIVILAVMVIIILICRKKGDDDEESSEKKGNDSSAQARNNNTSSD